MRRTSPSSCVQLSCRPRRALKRRRSKPAAAISGYAWIDSPSRGVAMKLDHDSATIGLYWAKDLLKRMRPCAIAFCEGDFLYVGAAERIGIAHPLRSAGSARV